MGHAAMMTCRDNKLPVNVFNINTCGELIRLVMDENIGTTVKQLD